MNFLFLGDEDRLKSDMSEKEDKLASSFSYTCNLPDKVDIKNFHAIIIPSTEFFNNDFSDIYQLEVPFFISGDGSDIQESFDFGCSDYLRIPWTEDELISRATKQLKIYELQKEHAWKDCLPACLDTNSTGPEVFRLAAFFSQNRGRKISRAELATALNLKNSEGRCIDMRVSRLRMALRATGNFKAACSIKCIKGAYSFE